MQLLGHFYSCRSKEYCGSDQLTILGKCLKDVAFWKKIIRLYFLFIVYSRVPLPFCWREIWSCVSSQVLLFPLLDRKVIDGELDWAGSYISYGVVHLSSTLS